MPQTLFTSQTPALPNVSEGSALTLGTTLIFTAAGSVTGARVYAPTTVTGTNEAAFWIVTSGDGGGAGTLLASKPYGTLTPGTWNTVTFDTPIPVSPGNAYVIGWRTSDGRYTATAGFFASALVNADITGIEGDSGHAGFIQLYNGRFGSGTSSYPASTFGRNGYWTDVIFEVAGGEVELAATLTATSGMTAPLVRETNLAAGLTATGSLTAPLVREAILAASLLATGSLSVALARETRLAASMTATASMTAPLQGDLSIAASMSASANLAVTFTVPQVGPVDLIATPVAEELLACFTEQLSALPSPPKYIQMRIGQETGPLIGPGVDECCAGLAWVRVADVYPSWDSFPQADNTWTPCGPLAYAVVLEMGMAFCMPWSDSEGSFDDVDPPSTADWAAAFATQMRDQSIMRRTAACCFRPTQRRAVGGWTSLPVEGGCTGGKLTVTVSVMNPCSDC